MSNRTWNPRYSKHCGDVDGANVGLIFSSAETVLNLTDSTTTFTQTTTSTKVETITVPSSTVTVTGSPSFAVIPLEKRNPVPATAAFQSLSFIQSINDGSASEALYADVIAACKCLHLEPRIDYIIASASVVRRRHRSVLRGILLIRLIGSNREGRRLSEDYPICYSHGRCSHGIQDTQQYHVRTYWSACQTCLDIP